MESEQKDLKDIIEQNNELLRENNKILKKLHRFSVIGFWTKFVWYALLIGLPFALYFYVLEPYFTALGSSYDTFYKGIQEIPGLKGMEVLLNFFTQSGT